MLRRKGSEVPLPRRERLGPVDLRGRVAQSHQRREAGLAFPLWESALTLGVSLLVAVIAESLFIALALVIGAAGLWTYALIDPEFAWPGVALLELEGATKRYGALSVVDDLSLHVEAGEALGVVGPNGAGKTTALSLIAGDVPMTFGRVRFDGRELWGDDGDPTSKVSVDAWEPYLEPA